MTAPPGTLAWQTSYLDLYQLHWPERYTPCFGELNYKRKSERADAVAMEVVRCVPFLFLFFSLRRGSWARWAQRLLRASAPEMLVSMLKMKPPARVCLSRLPCTHIGV